jgi:hypothetical protein
MVSLDERKRHIPRGARRVAPAKIRAQPKASPRRQRTLRDGRQARSRSGSWTTSRRLAESDHVHKMGC